MGFVLGVIAIGTLWNGTTVVVGVLRPRTSDGLISFLLALMVAVIVGVAALVLVLNNDALKVHLPLLVQLQWAFFAAPLGIFLATAMNEPGTDNVGAALILIAGAVVVLAIILYAVSIFFPLLAGDQYPWLANTLGVPGDSLVGVLHVRLQELTYSISAVLAGIASFVFSCVLADKWKRSSTGDRYRERRLERRNREPGWLIRLWRG